MAQQFIRIDKQDGSEEVVTLEAVQRIASLNYRDADLAMRNFIDGERIASAFAYYELRKVSEAKEAA